MTITELPIGIPVVVTWWSTTYYVLRLSDTDLIYTINSYSLGEAGTCRDTVQGWELAELTLIDQPTDSDAAEIGVVPKRFNHFTIVPYKVGDKAGAGEIQYNFDYAVPGARVASDGREQKLCECPLWGPVSLLSTGCTCNGV